MQIRVKIEKIERLWTAQLPGFSSKIAFSTKAKLRSAIEEAYGFFDPNVTVKIHKNDEMLVSGKDVKALLALLILSWTHAKSANQIKNEMGWTSRSLYYSMTNGKHEPSLSNVCELLSIFGKTLELNLVDLPAQKSVTTSSKKMKQAS